MHSGDLTVAGTTRARWGLGVLAVAFLAVAVWPFRPELPRSFANGARRDGSALALPSAGRLTGDAAPIVDAARAAGALVLEVEITGHEAMQRGPARIVELGTDHEHADLTLGQDGADLIVRFRRAGADDSGTPPLVVTDALRDAAPVAVRFTLTATRATLAVDGVSRAALELGGDTFRNWYREATLILGDSPVGDRSWIGRIERASITAGERVFDLLDDRTTSAPPRIMVWPARLRQVFAQRFVPPFDFVEVLLNLLAFVPIGFVAARAFPRESARSALVVGFLLSLSMETLQFGCAERIPSLVDLAVNLCGTGLGALVHAAPGGMLRRR
ncbi:MAG: VanZ family protein [Planctomycetota bacterium]